MCCPKPFLYFFWLKIRGSSLELSPSLPLPTIVESSKISNYLKEDWKSGNEVFTIINILSNYPAKISCLIPLSALPNS